MTFEIVFVIGIIIFAFILFVTEKFSLDATALLVLTILLLGGFLSIEEAISGFSNPAVIVISLLFVLSHALQKTRILEYLIVRINQIVSRSRTVGLGVYLFTISVASALMNNTAIVAVFMPVTIRLAHKYKLSPSTINTLSLTPKESPFCTLSNKLNISLIITRFHLFQCPDLILVDLHVDIS